MCPESISPPVSNILQIRNVEVVYDEAILGVHDISLEVAKGEIVALLGANGAGKSTTMKAISGMLLTERARVQSGDILLHGKSIVGVQPHHLTRQKIVHVLEGRRVFSHLTVEENLRAGAFVAKPNRAEMDTAIEEVYGWFPRLKQKRKTPAGLTSGGEQQMLAIGRALLTKPELMLLDEPSMGLAPIIVQKIFEIVQMISKQGVTILLVEQNAKLALEISDRGYVMESGRITMSGAASELLSSDAVQKAYLGE